MYIKFNHESGWINLKAEHIVEHMKIPTFKKWLKMFAKYGSAEQHQEFLQFIVPYVSEAEQNYADISNELTERQMKADGRLPTVMTRDYWQGEVKKYESKLNGAKAKVKRYTTIYEAVKGLVI